MRPVFNVQNIYVSETVTTNHTQKPTTSVALPQPPSHTQTGLSTYSMLKEIENHTGHLYSKPDRRFLRDNQKRVCAARRLRKLNNSFVWRRK